MNPASQIRCVPRNANDCDCPRPKNRPQGHNRRRTIALVNRSDSVGRESEVETTSITPWEVVERFSKPESRKTSSISGCRPASWRRSIRALAMCDRCQPFEERSPESLTVHAIRHGKPRFAVLRRPSPHTMQRRSAGAQPARWRSATSVRCRAGSAESQKRSTRSADGSEIVKNRLYRDSESGRERIVEAFAICRGSSGEQAPPNRPSESDGRNSGLVKPATPKHNAAWPSGFRVRHDVQCVRDHELVLRMANGQNRTGCTSNDLVGHAAHQHSDRPVRAPLRRRR